MAASIRKKKPVRRASRSGSSKKPAGTRFPGETAAYRKARDRLLKAELGLRRRIEAVAAMRRKLPHGGLVPEDYVFEEMAETEIGRASWRVRV